jgi:hypothetical protein
MTPKQWLGWAFESVTGWAWHRRLRRETGEVYMDRWQFCRTKRLSIYVNRINLPDADPLLHTHPWRRSYSLKLKGSYVEQLPGLEFRVPPRFNRVPDQHRIVRLVGDRPCWTLFVAFKVDRQWGFISNDGTLIPHRVRRAQRSAAQRGVESEL